MDATGVVTSARVVARGTVDRVLALATADDRGTLLLHNHPNGLLEPSGADLGVAARLHDLGIGFGIIDNDATDLYVVVEVPRARELRKLDPFEVLHELGPDGAVARALGRFEDRPSQRDMAAHIADAYNDGGVLLLEAGTGVGKSFAYLVPALAWARQNGERTVVSTNTIPLQEQLVGRDLPLLRDALATADHTPTFALLKGWRNYACLARLETAVAQRALLLEGDKGAELEALAGWAQRTADGSLADLPVQPTVEVWDEVSAEADLCTRVRCAHFDRCFVFRARRRAAEADIVVVNHHLLAADLAVRQAQDNWQDAAVLPPYRRLVLDEAHHLEDVAASHLGQQVSSRGVARLLARFERGGKGIVPALLLELKAIDDLLSRASMDLVTQRLLPALGMTRTASARVFELLRRVLEGEGVGQYRIGDDFARHEVWQDGLGPALDEALAGIRALQDVTDTIVGRLEQGELGEQRLRLVQELRGVTARLAASGTALAGTLRPPREGEPAVRWFERSGRQGQDLRLATVPLDLAPVLRELLFDKVETVALTSATLAAGGEFGFIRGRLGLAGDTSPVTVEETFASPFDYGSQCLFGIPDDLPDPREAEPEHALAVARVVADLAAASDGGMFVLFTSHAALRLAAAQVGELVGGRWPLLVQGEMGRDALLRRFREAGNAILLGTDSFWEGVDVPGRALRALVLTKLPFKVPSEPLTAARLERLQETGEDGFMGYLLPHAALKLKQGFGRLIRSRDDVGVVLLLDRRVLVKRYGPLVLSGLPPADRVVDRWPRVLARVEDFFARHGIGSGT